MKVNNSISTHFQYLKSLEHKKYQKRAIKTKDFYMQTYVIVGIH